MIYQKNIAIQSRGQNMIPKSKTILWTSKKSNTFEKDSIPLGDVVAYEILQRCWLAENPGVSELETLQASVKFTSICGLILKQGLLELEIRRLGGAA